MKFRLAFGSAGALAVAIATGLFLAFGPACHADHEGPGSVEAEMRLAREWPGSDLPWWEWSRATGDWGGVRPRWEDAGVAVESLYVVDWSSVWAGGVRGRGAGRSLFDANVTLDLHALFGI